MTGSMNRIPIRVEGISLIVAGSQHLMVILRGVYYDVGHGVGLGGELTLG